MKLLYASDYDSQTLSLSFYADKRKRFWNGEKDGIYQGKQFKKDKVIE